MPAGHGLRSRTRDLFARPFRKKGYIPLSTYLRTYKIGDYVDIKVNGAVHKGMPHKFYHGRTGRVWNVTKRAIGVEVNKQVGNRIIRKRIHVRVEHVQPSRCTEEFKLRKVKNDQLKAEAKAKGVVISTKRQPEGPKPGFKVEGATLETVTPIPYDVVNDLKGAEFGPVFAKHGVYAARIPEHTCHKSGYQCIKLMDKKCAMGEFLEMVIAMLKLAAINVLNPTKAALEFALKLLLTALPVNVPGLASSERMILLM
ncbi:Ribosomal protein L21e [Corchorus capsularis]|uniref:Ribosomal protein L21e n=1 Tax=Corchorus capsularis TaxID=210143 RepID=A0A1R3G922_COCAP|nr:Ribosomal protein L21e [Corchorus capsularis]